MRRYLDNAVIIDFTVGAVLGVSIYCLKDLLAPYFELPTEQGISDINFALIGFGATLLGFLLTIITVIVTFKNGFKPENTTIKSNAVEEVNETVFDKSYSKEQQFYGTDLYIKVTDVFIAATYEIGIILLIIFLSQFNMVKYPIEISFLVSMVSFGLVIVCLIRSFYMFKLFLRVHLKNEEINKIN